MTLKGLEGAKTFLLKINPGERNVNGQDIIMITKDSWNILIDILSGKEVNIKD